MPCLGARQTFIRWKSLAFDTRLSRAPLETNLFVVSRARLSQRFRTFDEDGTRVDVSNVLLSLMTG